MSILDSLNTKIALPDMSDYYYDAPDQQAFYASIDETVNPVRPRDGSDGIAYAFYQENPPELGYNSELDTYAYNVSLKNEKTFNDMQCVRNFLVLDGDTITLKLKDIEASDEQSGKYLDDLKAQKATEIKSIGADVDNSSILSLRFACVNAAEVPHFNPAGRASAYPVEDFKRDTVSYEDKKKDTDYVISKYQCFMDNQKQISSTFGNYSLENGTFYDYARTSKNVNVIKMQDGKYHQYFEGRDGNLYILSSAESNDYDEKKMADAGLARDIVVNAISKAEEMRIMINGPTISRDMQHFPTTKWDAKLYDEGIENRARKMLDFFTDDTTQFFTSGFNLFGMDMYGRAIAAVYVKLKDAKGNHVWVNLNKMVMADTQETEAKTFIQTEDAVRTDDYISRAFNPDSYKYDKEAYADNIFRTSSKFDDRAEVQKKIFAALGKPSAKAELKEWTLTIGDVTLFVPPTSIRVISQSKSERIPAVRAKGSVAKSPTKVQKILEIDLYFNGDVGINGYEYKARTSPAKDAPEITYWMNGLRALYAQFRVAPFLPIDNNYVNGVLGIDAVSMLNFSCDTVPGFPRLMKCTIQMTEFQYQVYMPEIPRDKEGTLESVLNDLEEPKSAKKQEEAKQEKKKVLRNYFAKQINYPLFRYYYQRLIRNGEALKDEKFMSEKYTDSTFGNKTCLIPAKFTDSKIRFFVPNMEQLNKLKQAKIERLRRPATITNLTAKDLDFAEDLAPIQNELEYAAGAEGSGIRMLNEYLKSLPQDKYLIIDSGSFVIASPRKIKDTNGTERILTWDIDKEETSTLHSHIDSMKASYITQFTSLKNKNGDSLCDEFEMKLDSKELDSQEPAVDAKFLFTMRINVPYMSEDELNDLRTYASGYTKQSADEIFKEKRLVIPISVTLVNTSANVDKRKYAAALGGSSDYFTVSNTQGAGFINFLSAVNQKQAVAGNKDVNELKGSVDLVTKTQLKWDPYNQDEDFRVEAIHMNTSNTFTQITLQSAEGYAPQYMGGTDIEISLSMYTTSQAAASAMSNLPAISAGFAREYRLVLTAWPLKIDCEFTKLFGVNDVMIEAVEVDTVPNMPGLYKIDMRLMSVDRTLRNREALKRTDLKNFHYLMNKEAIDSNRIFEYEQYQSYLSEAELYPDLELPTLGELKDNGFEFIRYKNNDQRKFPDPDFYFTYAYILTSALIRESVLNMLNSDASVMHLVDNLGNVSYSKLGDKVGVVKHSSKNKESATIRLEDVFQDKDELHAAQMLVDYDNVVQNRRNEVWPIAPNIKVALSEKRYSNHKNDKVKQDFKQNKTGDTPATSGDSQQKNIVNEKRNEIEQKLVSRIDAILGSSIDSLDLGSATAQLFRLASNLSEDNANISKLSSSAVKNAITAVADAVCSNGNENYQPDLSGGGNTVDSYSLEAGIRWRYREAFRSFYTLDGVPHKDEIPAKLGNLLRPKITAATYNEDIQRMSKYATTFGPFDIKFYTEEELQEKFGYYGNILTDEGKIATSRQGRYLADPLYRWASETEQYVYVMKCITDFDFACKAFFRIALLYFKVLLSYDILPSNEFDVMRSTLDQQDMIEKVMTRIAEKKNEQIAEQQKKAAEQQKKASQSERYKTKAGKTDNTAQASNNANSTDESAEENKQEAEKNKQEAEENKASSIKTSAAKYRELFRANSEAIDNGKLFLILALALVDGNPAFMKILRDRDYNTLIAMSKNALSPTQIQDKEQRSLADKITSFICALAGEGLIDYNLIGVNATTSPTDEIIKHASRLNAAAASEDPSQYLVHSFYDMVVHDCRGRMLRAFPTFYMILIDEGRKIGYWKLHDNFYNINSVASITISKSRKIPTDTAEVVMTNFFNTYTTEDEDLNMNYTSNFTDVFRSLWIPTLRSYAVEQENRRTNALPAERFRLRPGARMHIRMGYGGDACSLPILFNGMIAEVDTGDVVKIIGQSDGGELAKPIMFEKQAYELLGIDSYGITGVVGPTSNENSATPKQIITSLMCCHGGMINKWIHAHGYDDVGNMLGTPHNPLGIYHFGNPDINYCGEPEPIQNVFEMGQIPAKERYINKKAQESGDEEIEERYESEESPRLNFDAFGKTVWDVLHICKSIDTEYYTAILPFRMRSTVFFGRSHDYYAYDYEKIDGTWVEKRKPYQQFHIYTSFTDVISNNMAVSPKDIKTCGVGLYEVSGFANASVQKKTDPVWVDAAIYPEYQKTMYVDTKLYGEPSRKLSIISDIINFIGGGITNSLLDRGADSEGDVQNWHALATRMVVNALHSQMKEMYQGQIVLIGDPTVKPHDMFLLHDNYNEISGCAEVRDVVHVFSAQDGFKTVITPDLISTALGQAAEKGLKKTGALSLAAANVVSALAVRWIIASPFISAMETVGSFVGTASTALKDAAAVQKMAALAEDYRIFRAMESAGSTVTSVTKGGTLVNIAKTIVNLFRGGKTAAQAAEAAATGTGAAAAGAIAATPPGWLVIATALGLIAATEIGVALLSAGVDTIFQTIKNRKSLVIIPMKKYGKPYIGGMDGHVGTVYGAPNFNAEDAMTSLTSGALGVMQKMWDNTPTIFPKWFSDFLWGENNILSLADAYNQKQQILEENSDEYKAVMAMNAEYDSHMESFSKEYFNPLTPRITVTDKASMEQAVCTYGIKAHTIAEVNADQKLDQMVPIMNEKRLKYYLDMGYFRVAAHDKGFTSALSDKIHCEYIRIPKTNKVMPINVVFDEEKAIYDIPYLHEDASGVLCSIVNKSFRNLMGTEQTRDPIKWYKDNEKSFLTITSALKAGSDLAYESTGFSFILTASDSKVQKATASAIKDIGNELSEAHAKKANVVEKIMSVKMDNMDFKILVHPPEDNT